LKALIFDVDGTLAETEELHRAAFNQAFVAAGLDWHWDRTLYAELLAVTGGKERIRFAIDRGARPALDASAIAGLHAAKTQHYTGGIASVALRPGIHRLLDAAAAGMTPTWTPCCARRWGRTGPHASPSSPPGIACRPRSQHPTYIDTHWTASASLVANALRSKTPFRV